MIQKTLVYFFTREDFKRGLKEKWITNSFQKGMRNSDKGKRKGKYSLICQKVPDDYLVFIKNFNEEPEEFAEMWPEWKDM